MGGKRNRPVSGFITKKDGAVLAFVGAYTRAQLDEIFVGINNRAVYRLGRARVVAAIVEGNPPPAISIACSNLWPRHTLAHTLKPSPLLGT